MPSVAISTASSGNTELVPAVSGKRVRVWKYVFQCAGDVNVKFRSANTDLTGAFPNTTNTGMCVPADESPWFETVAGEALNINLSAAIGVYGVLVYSYSA